MRINLLLLFVVHCARRARPIQRAMKKGASFECMMGYLSPLSGHGSLPEYELPEVYINRAGQFCAYLMPSVWRRRCLFRSLLILDWAHCLGIDPTFNVGMRLDPSGDQGHCWLSMGVRPFCESGGWPSQYDTLIHRDKGVQYWVTVVPDTDSQNHRSPNERRIQEKLA